MSGLISGFTGTRRGLTSFQRLELLGFLAEVRPARLHHGDCLGADGEAHFLSRALGIPVVIHPPDRDEQRAWCQAGPGDLVLPAKDYLSRDHDIVDASDYLLACPHGEEELRSGTWATVRYARKRKKPVYLLLPDGRVEVDISRYAR